MALTQTQLDARRAWMGATDVARVMTGRAHDVLAEKRFGVTAAVLDENNQMTLGDDLEQPVIRYAERHLGPLVVHPELPVVNDYGFPLRPAPDAMVEQTGEPVEAKTSGILNPRMADEWGDEGTDEVPEYYIWQCTTHIMSGVVRYIDRCHLPALIAGRGYGMFKIARNRDLIDAIATRCRTFWEILETGGDLDHTWGTGPSMDTLKAIQRTPGKRIVLPDDVAEIAASYDTHRRLRLKIENGEDACKALLVAALGDAETGVLPDGRIVEVKRVARAAYAVSEGESVRVTVRNPKRKELE